MVRSRTRSFACHAPGRELMRGVSHPLPSLEDVVERTILEGRLTNPRIRCVGAALNTSGMSESSARSLLSDASSRFGGLRDGRDSFRDGRDRGAFSFGVFGDLSGLRRRLWVAEERWPLSRPFAISRSVKEVASVVWAAIEVDGLVGFGEGVPYGRYGESASSAIASIESARDVIESGASIEESSSAVLSFSGRNAINCALWDLETRLRGESLWRLADLPSPGPLVSATTAGLDSPSAMADCARRLEVSDESTLLIKMKLGGGDGEDGLRISAIRKARPSARLIADANEGWTPSEMPSLLSACVEHGVELVEQPLPADRDSALRDMAIPEGVVLCADESFHVAEDAAGLADRYGAVNVKLDKTGGFSGALSAYSEARRLGMRIMAGCMACTSLSIVPAFHLAQRADVVDLDGSLLLRRDRDYAPFRGVIAD